MANYYISLTGSNGTGDGTYNNPYRTVSYTQGQVASGSTIIILGDSFYNDTNRVLFNDPGILQPEESLGCTVAPRGVYSSRLVEINESISGTSTDSVVLKNLIFDGQGTSSTALLAEDGANIQVSMEHCHTKRFRAGLSINQARQNTMWFTYVTGVEAYGDRTDTNYFIVVGSGTAFAQDGAQGLVINECDFDITRSTEYVQDIIFTQTDSNSPYDTVVTVTNNTIDLTYIDDGQQLDGVNSILQFVGIEDLVITGNMINVDYTDDPSGSEMNAIDVSGLAVDQSTTGAAVSYNKIDSNMRAGYVIAVGWGSTESYIYDTEVCGNYVKGKYWSDYTPHGIAFRYNATGAATGNIVEEIYVGYLFNQTGEVSVSGNIALNCYGPSYYVKGYQGSAGTLNIRGNVAVVDKNTQLRTYGIMCVIYQGDEDTQSADFYDNYVIFEGDDPAGYFAANGSALAAVANVDQLNTSFTNNVYYLRDTVDVENDLLFGDNAVYANATLEDWNNRAGNSDEKIILLNDTEMTALVNKYKNLAEAAANQGTSISGGGGNSLSI